jgi:hypothetical protein
MKIQPVGAEMLHADGQTGMTKLVKNKNRLTQHIMSYKS